MVHKTFFEIHCSPFLICTLFYLFPNVVKRMLINVLFSFSIHLPINQSIYIMFIYCNVRDKREIGEFSLPLFVFVLVEVGLAWRRFCKVDFHCSFRYLIKRSMCNFHYWMCFTFTLHS